MWIYILIALIVIAAIVIGILLYMRNTRKDVIREQQERLDHVKSLPFQDELIKVKSYNLHGEVESLYEDWQAEWQKVINSTVESANEDLHTANELLEKFKFNDSEKHTEQAMSRMDECEAKYDKLSNEINQLLDHTEQAEQEFSDSERIVREARRDILASGHKYGDASIPLEELVESYEPELKKYHTLNNGGDYVSANEHIDEIYEELVALKENMDEIPLLIKDVQKDLPQAFNDLRFGCRDLKADGYDLEHVKVESKLSTLKGKLNLIEPLIARLELDEARKIINDINDELDDMFELVEIEVRSKQQVDSKKDVITDKLFNAKDLNYTLRTEIDYLRDQIHINESDIHTVQKYESEIENLIDVYDEIITETSKIAVRFSEVLDNLDYIEEHIGAIYDEQEKIQEHLINLREDESEARENAQYVLDKKEEVFHSLNSSNLTEIPERFIVMKNELDIDINEIHKYFQRRPLNIQYIKDKVGKTVILMNKFEQDAYEILHEAELTELMIQYGNRYRRGDPDFNNKLNEAERLFKENRYKRALTIVREALDKVEPGASERIEDEFDK